MSSSFTQFDVIVHRKVMSTTDSPEPHPVRRSEKPHSSCHVTKGELLENGLQVLDDCLICLDANIRCRVGAHPLSSSARGFPVKYN
jgi:hypothetical protein